MRVDLAVLADAANVSQEGKLNICGIFSQISGAQVPLVYSGVVVLVIRFILSAGEKGRLQRTNIRLVDEDGQTVTEFPQLNFTIPANAPGSEVVFQPIINLAQPIFQKFGDHVFDVVVNDTHMTNIKLSVVQVKGQPGQPGNPNPFGQPPQA